MSENPQDNIPQLFKEQIQDCLSHLYDYAFLQDHEVVRLLTPNVAATQRVQVFRQLIIDTIEHFSPGVKVDFHSRQARTYNILLLRYIEGHDPQDLMQQLAFSQRQFYREHRRAIEALSSVLWEGIQEAPHPEAADDEIKNISVQSEIQRAFSHSDVTTSDLRTFLDGISGSIGSLATRQGVSVEVRTDEPLATVEVDLMALRQAVILIAARLVLYATQQKHMLLQGRVADTETQITIEIGESSAAAEAIHDMLAQQESLQYLLEALDARLDCTEGPGRSVRVTLALARRKHTILVIDDNPDVHDLFKRYLVGQSYQILGAAEAQQAIQLAREEQPEMIVLDIMLPGKDGWELLQNFKNHPATKHIPVLICSVLDAPDVAYSLGGDDYLRKPPGRSDFLTALARWQK